MRKYSQLFVVYQEQDPENFTGTAVRVRVKIWELKKNGAVFYGAGAGEICENGAGAGINLRKWCGCGCGYGPDTVRAFFQISRNPLISSFGKLRQNQIRKFWDTLSCNCQNFTRTYPHPHHGVRVKFWDFQKTVRFFVVRVRVRVRGTIFRVCHLITVHCMILAWL